MTIRRAVLWFLATAVLTFGAHGQADMTELRTTQILTDGWRFVFDDDLADSAALASTGLDWAAVTLPHSWNAEDAASLQATGYERGVGWYRLEFPTPAAGARHWLEFGAASLVADVWLNGQSIGSHKGAFTTFRFDVTDDLAAPGTVNVLLVKVDNSLPRDDDDRTAIPPMGGDFNVSGGLYRHVALVSTPRTVHFDLGDTGGPGVYATTASIASGAAQLRWRAKVASDSLSGEGHAGGHYTVRLSLVDAAGQVAATIDRPIEVAESDVAEVNASLDVPNPHLWQGTADPYLYKLVAEVLGGDGLPIDRIVQSFGIRQMRFDPNEGFFLNGQHVRWHGVAVHQDFLGKAWATTNADVDTSLALIQEIGANAIRFGHYPFSQYWMQRADELGLIAWYEAAMGVRTSVDRCVDRDASPAFVESAKQQLTEFIRQSFNHASASLWAVANETTQGQRSCGEDKYDNVRPVLRALHEHAKRLDPTHPTGYAEFPEPVPRKGLQATEGITDVYGSNRYFWWYTQEVHQMPGLLDDLHDLAADHALVITEYGGGAALTHHTDNPLGGPPEVRSAPEGAQSSQPEEYAAYLHEQNWRVLSSKPYLVGSFVWNMFDFGSGHRNEGDVLGVNTKGLVSFDRQTRKDPFYFYKANWTSTPTTHIVGRRYTNRAYAVVDVKVYSNADSVDLAVNGVPAGSLTAERCEQRTCIFPDVTLAQGLNTVVATGNHAGVPVADTVEWTLATEDVNIAAGRLATGLMTAAGALFGSDEFFVAGDTGFIDIALDPIGGHLDLGDDPSGGDPAVEGTDDRQLFKYFRFGEFSYDIPLPDGNYAITLGFVEPDKDVAVGDRVFSVTANGQLLVENLDVLAEAGAAHTAFTKTYLGPITGGRLILEFTPVEGDAIVSNIKIIRQF
jgi:beta-galactosidase